MKRLRLVHSQAAPEPVAVTVPPGLVHRFDALVATYATRFDCTPEVARRIVGGTVLKLGLDELEERGR